MTSVVLSIGSNLGDRVARLQSVVDGLGGAVRAVSPVYETDPWGGVEQGAFLNAVVLADTTLSARTLLERALAIEDAYGRERTGEYGAPRTLDVDLIVVGDRRASDPDMVLPHPKAHERAFVLAPWNDVEPDAELLDHGPVAELLAKAGLDGITLRDDLALTLQ
jgi:2-amino-4-hydroxy-6-hydroxymethyldihydropteridine diphosphokinase